MESDRLTTVDVRWDIQFTVALGATAGRFMAGLRDRIIMGTSCRDCGWVFVPPQEYCERCLAPAEQWLELPSTGVVEAYTVVHIAPGGRKPPFILGTIRLDGADGLLLHHVGGFEIGPDGDAIGLEVGARVQAVWAEDRVGSILDIEHFGPAAP